MRYSCPYLCLYDVRTTRHHGLHQREDIHFHLAVVCLHDGRQDVGSNKNPRSPYPSAEIDCTKDKRLERRHAVLINTITCDGVGGDM